MNSYISLSSVQYNYFRSVKIRRLGQFEVIRIILIEQTNKLYGHQCTVNIYIAFPTVFTLKIYLLIKAYLSINNDFFSFPSFNALEALWKMLHNLLSVMHILYLLFVFRLIMWVDTRKLQYRSLKCYFSTNII